MRSSSRVYTPMTSGAGVRDMAAFNSKRQGLARPERLSRHSGGKFRSLSLTTLLRPFSKVPSARSTSLCWSL